MPVSYPISEIVVADTGVFWDIAYCPIPGGLGPEKNYQNIKLALKNMGYYGKLSIFAYGDENIITQKILKRAESNAYSQEKNRQGLTRSCTTSPFGEYARKKRRDERM